MDSKLTRTEIYTLAAQTLDNMEPGERKEAAAWLEDFVITPNIGITDQLVLFQGWLSVNDRLTFDRMFGETQLITSQA